MIFPCLRLRAGTPLASGACAVLVKPACQLHGIVACMHLEPALCCVLVQHAWHHPLHALRRHTFGIWSLRWSSDGAEVIAGTGDHSLYVYSMERQQVCTCPASQLAAASAFLPSAPARLEPHPPPYTTNAFCHAPSHKLCAFFALLCSYPFSIGSAAAYWETQQAFLLDLHVSQCDLVATPARHVVARTWLSVHACLAFCSMGSDRVLAADDAAHRGARRRRQCCGVPGRRVVAHRDRLR